MYNDKFEHTKATMRGTDNGHKVQSRQLKIDQHEPL